MSATSLEQDDYFSDSVATFGDRLQAAREAKGMSITDLAEKLGVEASRVEAWESDADVPRANRIQLLAGLLSASIVWLISGEGNGTSNAADGLGRPTRLNDALAEVAQLKSTLQGAIERLDTIEKRLLDLE